MTGPLRLDRALIRVSGPEAVSFLDNLLTQDVTRLAEARAQYAALLTPQGKVITDMMLWADGDSVVIEADPARAGDLLRRLSMYKLRAAVALEDVTHAHMVVWSETALPGGQPDPRSAALGWRALAARETAAPSDAAFNAHRLALGVPDLAHDCAPDEVFAGEALLEELNGVDFKKGCFVGQENVSRMKRRATTRKKFCPVTFAGAAPAFGAVVSAGAAELGQIRTGMDGRAMALLRLDRALAAQEDGVKILAEGKEMRLAPPPWLILPPREGAAAPASTQAPSAPPSGAPD
jgi:folate-binding protein YgfZ